VSRYYQGCLPPITWEAMNYFSNRKAQLDKEEEMDHSEMTHQEYEFENEILTNAFELVKPKPNWKYDINTILPKGTDIRLIEDAIIYFCGCGADFETLPNGKIRVTAIGYYMAVGA